MENLQRKANELVNLQRKANELVERYTITSNNYETVKNCLEERFDKPNAAVGIPLTESDKFPVAES